MGHRQSDFDHSRELVSFFQEFGERKKEREGTHIEKKKEGPRKAKLFIF